MQNLDSVPLFASRRRHARHDYREPFELLTEGRLLVIDALNISRSGVAGVVRGIAPLAERARGRVVLHRHRPISGTVRWMRGREVGISFTEDLANHPRLHALVVRIENGEPPVPARRT